jgi:hypothetical protein
MSQASHERRLGIEYDVAKDTCSGHTSATCSTHPIEAVYWVLNQQQPRDIRSNLQPTRIKRFEGVGQ